jgi:hypothetical protein
MTLFMAGVESAPILAEMPAGAIPSLEKLIGTPRDGALR